MTMQLGTYILDSPAQTLDFRVGSVMIETVAAPKSRKPSVNEHSQRNFAYVKKLTLDLKNCYGIRSLQHTFDFAQQNRYAIYAPNGSMKSSLAQTFRDVSSNVPSKDRIFPTRTSVRNVTDENGSPLIPASVLVV